MKLTKKYIRVYSKLAWRNFRKSTSTYAISMMSLVVVCGLFSGIYHTLKFSNVLKESTFTKWERQQEKYVGRTIANKADTCLTEFNYDQIQAMVKELEATYETGHLVKGSWHGINLEKLPAIQAQLIVEYGHLIGDQKKATDYQACADIICVFNKVYRDRNPIAGHLVYYWYLKTGSMLSLSNLLPNQETNYPGKYAGKSYELNDYLFSIEELKNFFVLAKSLPESFLNIPLIKSFHKLPHNAPLDPVASTNGCSHALSNGSILIKDHCLGNQSFFLNTTHEIARYIDLHKGSLNEAKSISSDSTWEDLSLWVREDYWQPSSKEYQFKWLSHYPNGQELSNTATRSPAGQLAEMLAHYRFNPEEFELKTPQQFIRYISTNFYNSKTYNPKGLQNQFLNTSIKLWDQNENEIWKKCFHDHLGPESDIKFKNVRDVASTLKNPLYSCVETEVGTFIEGAIDELRTGEVKACEFFSDNSFHYYAREYVSSLDKYIQEKIVQRKLELKEFGEQVILAQAVKDQFKKSFDPKSVYINCYTSNDQKKCYEASLQNLAHSAVAESSKIKGYYKKLLEEELTYMFQYEEVAAKTNLIVKKFLTPFNFKIEQTAGLIIDECKSRATSSDEKLKLPLIFTGGKNFVASSVINCVNKNFEHQLDDIVNAGTFQFIDDNKVEYKLGYKEKKFARNFLKLRFKNSLLSLVEEQKRLENNSLASTFKKNHYMALEKLRNAKNLFEDVYTMDHVQDKCIETINEFYPEKFYYSSKKEVDEKYGRKICSVYVDDPEVNKLVNNSINKNWNKNKLLVHDFFTEEFADEVEVCKNDFPTRGNRGYSRNSRMLKICIEESFSVALSSALQEWRSEDSYKYFASKERELINDYSQQRGSILQAAWK